MAPKSEMVTVKISCSERVYYRQEIQLSRVKFEILNALWTTEDGLGIGDEVVFLDLIDRSEVCDADDPEVDDFDLVKPTE